MPKIQSLLSLLLLSTFFCSTASIAQDELDSIDFFELDNGAKLPNTLQNEVKNTSLNNFQSAINTYSMSVYSCTALDISPTYYWNIITPDLASSNLNSIYYLPLQWQVPAESSWLELNGNCFEIGLTNQEFHFDITAAFADHVDMTIMQVHPGSPPSSLDQIIYKERLNLYEGNFERSEQLSLFIPGTYCVSFQSDLKYQAATFTYSPIIHEISFSNS